MKRQSSYNYDELIACGQGKIFGVGNARFRTSGDDGFVDCLAFGAYRREVFNTLLDSG